MSCDDDKEREWPPVATADDDDDDEVDVDVVRSENSGSVNRQSNISKMKKFS